MKNSERKIHWENVFETKDTTKVSWFQPIPKTSIKIIDKLNLPKTARIIDVGSGDGFLADFLLEKGYSEITLLDISEKALAAIRKRLVEKGFKVTFLAEDVVDFVSDNRFDLWHDRAAFHFLIEKTDIQKYLDKVAEKLNSGGFLIISTFSDNGPDMCSGLQVRQYSENQLTELFGEKFNKIECFTENHQTPSGSSQNFQFCVFQKVK